MRIYWLWIFICILLFSNALVAEEVELSNSYQLRTEVDWKNSAKSINFVWQPELSYKSDLICGFASELSMYNRFSIDSIGQQLKADQDFKLHRLWLRYESFPLEVRLGRQRINFGTARLIRSLDWFEKLDPLDANEHSQGVDALLGKAYFDSQTGIWLWGIRSQKGYKGNEIYPSPSAKTEWGGRWESSFPQLESGFSFHNRKVGIDSTQVSEYRGGLDLRYDGAVGLWMENSLSVYDSDTSVEPDYHGTATVGLDFTFTCSLYLLCESALSYNEQDYKAHSALLLDLPLGLLDKLSSLSIIAWDTHDMAHTLMWRRSYDQFGLEARINYGTGQLKRHSLSLGMDYHF